MISVVVICFWITLFFSVAYFVWDGIVAPIIRVRMRFKLFAVRDRIRELKSEDAVEQDTLDFFESVVNSGIFIVHNFGLIDFLMMQMQVRNQRKARKCSVPPCLQNEMMSVMECVRIAIVVNSLFLLIWIVPLVYLMTQLTNATRLVFQKQSDLEEYFPRNYAS